MKALSIEIPDAAYELTAKLASEQKLSPQQLLAISLGQYLAHHAKDPYLEALAQRGRHQDGDGLKDFLDRSPDVEPEEYDRL